ncbi:hypothetical protein F7734_50990 [Scytonema sp. UIC 10036]|uniref:hypothetical protein n=1 Tax=Scytonema sp. UIC 10036 TaxID=2304196 RepID=UPI0012DAB916|nr:hypothetical protein [Scytonema sp. UIC 10036]MUG92897.1 hypothetical protein [Scytonema sp. UIC 10036]MUG96625.1 hypothetical protein [Scytonema sp. UIC 10036]MUG98549.1 hypothetical protein [Scytonema sp. UIC 10036]MUG98891.1 hypothetical protein [Scytonema sp. UIC 10036]MUH00163.1 hypothetical protein [Scytonema sp. UIC 10036]
MLKKKKGFRIATKSVKCKLERNGFDLNETKAAFNEVVHFYFALVNTHPSGVNIPVAEDGGWRYYEKLTIGSKTVYPFPFNGFPVQFRRAAIRKAIGAWQSWNSNYQKWLNRPNQQKHHRPPLQPRSFNFSPSFDAGVWKEDDGQSIILKILVNGQWKWVKFQYLAPLVDAEWVKGSPLVVVKGNAAYIVFPLQKYIPATGGIKTIMAQDSLRVLGVDMDLDRHIAICSVLEVNAKGEVFEVTRHFIKQTSHTKRRKRQLGRIAKKMQQTGTIHKGFASKMWENLHNREVELGRAYARQIVELAKTWGCSVIAFEHLGNLKPIRGKYSRRSNQKRAYWLKSSVYRQVSRIAYQDYGILTTRVNPRNTSRFDPWGNPVWRSNEFPKTLFDFQSYEKGANFVGTVNGYIAHSGLNAARNIALKAILRHRTNLVFRTGTKYQANSAREKA